MKKNREGAIVLTDAVEKILASGLSVYERENNSDTSDGTTHITIIGGVRPVEFWPTTGSVFASGVKGKFNHAKGRGIADAIRIAREGK